MSKTLGELFLGLYGYTLIIGLTMRPTDFHAKSRFLVTKDQAEPFGIHSDTKIGYLVLGSTA